MITISLQQEPFNTQHEQQKLQVLSFSVGAVVEFTGFVRNDPKHQQALSAIFLEHYPSMAEKAITKIVQQAVDKWSLIGVTVIHRTGYLAINEPIVYVAIASKHRKEGLQALDFIMDFLKNDVPIWKKEIVGEDAYWVEQKTTDISAKQAWLLNE